MLQYALKVALSVIVIVAVSELSKRETWWAALLASLPIVSLLSIIWLYTETGDTAKVSALSWGILWLVLPSLAFFVVLPLLLNAAWNFWPSLIAAGLLTAVLYGGELWLLPKLGIQL